MDHTKLLCDISELNHLFRDSVSVENFLQQIVTMVGKHMRADVCSIYLYDEDKTELRLKATRGLSTDSINHVKLKLGEGVTGLALKELRPVSIENASKHPQSKIFNGIGEEEFENILAVPILRGIQRVGVMVLQRKMKSAFHESDILACKAVASQLANIIENARFLISMHAPQESKEKTSIKDELNFVRGKVASQGYAFANSCMLNKRKTYEHLKQANYDKIYSIDDFKSAIEKTTDQLEDLQKAVEEKLSDAASLIFASHLMILKDREFVGQMESLISQGTNPPKAVLQIAKKYIDIFSVGENHFVREKVQDVEDLTVRIIGNILSEDEEFTEFKNRIVIAKDIFPSDLLKMASEKVSGIILVSGGVTSHLSILARSLQLPVIIANNSSLLKVPDSTKILLDAEAGNIYIEPDDEIVEQFEQRNLARESVAHQVEEVKPETYTKDSVRIKLFANINLLSDIKLANQVMCEGVGLYRTEFPFIIRNNFPSEEEQYITYRKLVKAMGSRPIIFRTLDVGGDKVLSYYHDANEQNPAIGMRSIRFSLQNKEVFVLQIRAMLRAGLDSDLRIMFPMISSVDEFDKARSIVDECKASLSNDGFEFNDSPQIGMMIELPSVVELIDDFAKEADFFSIGTNDFIQFMLGVDRTNENVAPFYMPYHPSVLRAMKKVVEAANKHNKSISVCGSMSSEEVYIKFLIGIGLTNLSLNPASLPRVQELISSISLTEAKEYVDTLVSKSRASEIAQLMGIEPQ